MKPMASACGSLVTKPLPNVWNGGNIGTITLSIKFLDASTFNGQTTTFTDNGVKVLTNASKHDKVYINQTRSEA
jgi:hypothetical protein